MTRCIACFRVIWPWSPSGWYVTEAGILRWHAPRCPALS